MASTQRRMMKSFKTKKSTQRWSGWLFALMSPSKIKFLTLSLLRLRYWHQKTRWLMITRDKQNFTFSVFVVVLAKIIFADVFVSIHLKQFSNSFCFVFTSWLLNEHSRSLNKRMWTTEKQRMAIIRRVLKIIIIDIDSAKDFSVNYSSLDASVKWNFV